MLLCALIRNLVIMGGCNANEVPLSSRYRNNKKKGEVAVILKSSGPSYLCVDMVAKIPLIKKVLRF